MLGVFYFSIKNQQLYCLFIFLWNTLFVRFQVLLRVNAYLKRNSFDLDFQVLFVLLTLLLFQSLNVPNIYPIY